MSDRPKKRPANLRRSLESGPQQPSLTRRLWGLTRAGAERLLAEQDQLFAQELSDMAVQLRQERTIREQLVRELDLKRKQLKAVRGIVEVFREKLAKERAAKAVLAARLMDQEVEELKERQAAMLAMTRVETARTGADVEREMEAVRQLVQALYRTVVGKAGIPEGLDVITAEFGIGDVEPDTWQSLLTEKRVGRPLLGPDGKRLAGEGDAITAELLETVVEKGLLWDLVLAMKLPLVNCDL